MEKDAIDLKYAKMVADYIGADHTEVFMTKEEVIDSLEKVISILGTYDITTIRASMGMYLCCKKIHEISDLKVLLTGEISDELFGYKYTDFAPDAKSFQRLSLMNVLWKLSFMVSKKLAFSSVSARTTMKMSHV